MAGNRLEGAALVTGAGSGIGRAVSVTLTVAGVSTIYLTDISASGLAETETIIANLGFHTPPRVACIPGDISSPEFVTSLFAKIPELHYAVNCAGVVGEARPTAEVSLEDFDRVNGVNYRGLWLCVKEELKLMLQNDIKPYTGFTLSQGEAHTRGQRGSIVNIASQLGLVGKPHASAYTGSKAAVMSMTRSDALDYSKPPHYIRINSICPGVVATPLTTNEDGSVPERLRDAINIAPMQRMGLPSEIADTAVFLCSGESSFVTGHSLVVDGGYVIR